MTGAAIPVIGGLAVGVIFITIIAITFSQSAQDSKESNALPDRNVKLARLNGSIDFDAGHTINNTSSVGDWDAVKANEPEAVEQFNRIQNAIESCERHYVHIYYGLGSMAIAIEGLDKDSGLCSMAIHWEVEMGWQMLDCYVPREVMASWERWKEDTNIPRLEEISDYCKEVPG